MGGGEARTPRIAKAAAILAPVPDLPPLLADEIPDDIEIDRSGGKLVIRSTRETPGAA
jgi:hypothetical protein